MLPAVSGPRVGHEGTHGPGTPLGRRVYRCTRGLKSRYGRRKLFLPTAGNKNCRSFSQAAGPFQNGGRVQSGRLMKSVYGERVDFGVLADSLQHIGERTSRPPGIDRVALVGEWGQELPHAGNRTGFEFR